MDKKLLFGMFLTTSVLASCSILQPTPVDRTGDLTPVVLMLDWVPNTNHVGLYVADELGYFEDQGLDVEIIEPGEVFAEQAVIGGVADFGISFQEQMTLARADDIPLVSVAAIIQHNTSGFASRLAADADSPADWEGLTYGSFGSPFEAPTLTGLMSCDSGDFNQLEIVDTGFADPLALLDEEQIDLAWIFYGWQGIQANQQGISLNVVMLEDWFECIPDYYTPVIVVSEATIAKRPEVVRAFLHGASRGYETAIEDPQSAATLLLGRVPELDETLVRESLAWLAPRFQAESPRWGEQDLETWTDYSAWMAENQIIAEPIDGPLAFTNDFLP